MKDILKSHIQNRLNTYVLISNTTGRSITNEDTINQKQASHKRRGAEIVKCSATAKIHSIHQQPNEDEANIIYEIHTRYLIKQKNNLYLEEEVDHRYVQMIDGTILQDFSIIDEGETKLPRFLPPLEEDDVASPYSSDKKHEARFKFSRMEAVKYAEQYWNSYNPQFKKFDVNCTNYISQCLYAGGAPMIGYPKKSGGWWMRNNDWSYTWTVAHAMRWYLPKAKQGLKAKEVNTVMQLMPGDVICYDFEGDGRFDHTTIVVAKDENKEPLVNANTYNCRMRYWKYEDSTAYTPNMKYKFFHILDR
ncbi:Putative amidase domain protein [Bacillus sp. THAF10]|uniref:amidase domain-containing protein n=1 Tax=Bacillus sp. THAF10 TaxID=2587848 RepID=UPI001267B6F6|nr:amidase domain-containing protein [Bacillus sp. THAF10]QFT88100.1 Putative amidase domain protein [Bacillus sp. THAF10]